MGKILLEICAASTASAIAAQRGGADRIELCAALPLGGLTPSYGAIKEAKQLLDIPIRVLIRAREGDFVYSDHEISQMCEDILISRDLGVEGVVCGALDIQGNIDIKAMDRMARAAEGMRFTFHRAFDQCADPFDAIMVLAELGVDTILTSGQAPSAVMGIPLLSRLIPKACRHGITIMPGSGVSTKNIAEIVGITGAQAIHLSAKQTVTSQMRLRRDEVSMGKGGGSEYDYEQTDMQTVKACHEILNNI